MGARAELRLHAHDEVEKLFTLNDLRGGLAAHRRLHHRFHVGDVDPVAGDLFAIRVNDQAGLAQLAHHGQFGKARHFFQGILDFQGILLKDVQIRRHRLSRRARF